MGPSSGGSKAVAKTPKPDMNTCILTNGALSGIGTATARFFFGEELTAAATGFGILSAMARGDSSAHGVGLSNEAYVAIMEVRILLRP
jgi:hypothetical protein